jgi:hypothetical protein
MRPRGRRSWQPRAERHGATARPDATENDSGPRERAVADEIAPTWAPELAASTGPTARRTARPVAAENDSDPRERAVVDEIAPTWAQELAAKLDPSARATDTTGRARK